MPDFLLQLRPAPGCRVPGIIGLRRLLKTLLRSFGFVCIAVSEVHDGAQDHVYVAATVVVNPADEPQSGKKTVACRARPKKKAAPTATKLWSTTVCSDQTALADDNRLASTNLQCSEITPTEGPSDAVSEGSFHKAISERNLTCDSIYGATSALRTASKATVQHMPVGGPIDTLIKEQGAES